MINSQLMPHMTTPLHYAILLCVAFCFQVSAQQKTINSGWQFSEDKTEWITVNLPHTWNLQDAFDDKPGYRRGLGHYRKQLYFSKDQKEKIQYLKFNAVNQEATVFVNGQVVGRHRGGYTAFTINITEFLTYDAYNLIEVTVDNSHNINIPPLDADFTFYGGIYRDVALFSVPKQHLSMDDFASDGFYVDYPHVSEEKAGVEVTVLLDNFEAATVATALALTLTDADGNQVSNQSRKLTLGGNASETIKIRLPDIANPKLWSPERPYLYKLHIELTDANGHVLDEKTANVAFRWVRVDPDQGFFLNGKPYKLIGVNRHQDFEGYGNAVPMHLQENDIRMIKAMGANVIRFAHYPHARQLYALCDALGILVWTEVPVINIVTPSADYFEVSLDMQKAHIKQYYNFPSVVMLGYMNEIFLRMAFDTTMSEKQKSEAKAYTYELAQQLETLTRAMAPNRLTVMALHGSELYNETKIADLPMLIGWNLYYGWYHDDIDDLGAFLDAQHQQHPNRSIMISEYGPGADVRISTPTPKKYDFSQEYQLKLHKGYYRQVMERDFVAGMTAWNFADFGSEFRGDAIPHVNQKGLVQYNREPKDIYYWYQAILSDAPFVHIAMHPETTLNLIQKNTVMVTLLSNQSTGDVMLNGQMLQQVEFENGVATVEVPFVNGSNALKVITEDATTFRKIQVAKIEDLRTYVFDRLAINIGSHFNVLDAENSCTWIADRAYTEHLFGYVDGKIYNASEENHQGIPQNIVNTELDPVFQTMLEGCTTYKVDLPDGDYKISLYFVEPKLNSGDSPIYNLDGSENTGRNDLGQRIFDVVLNGALIESQLNLSKAYPKTYGVTVAANISIKNDLGLTVHLKPIEGQPVISGILIEKR